MYTKVYTETLKELRVDTFGDTGVDEKIILK
jgi:hypothetical protein